MTISEIHKIVHLQLKDIPTVISKNTILQFQRNIIKQYYENRKKV